jgi:hypothetical protein
MDKKKNNLQLIWGIALFLSGIGVFYRIPQVMPKIISIIDSNAAVIFIRFSFYFIGILLAGGGVKKIAAFFKKND